MKAILTHSSIFHSAELRKQLRSEGQTQNMAKILTAGKAKTGQVTFLTPYVKKASAREIEKKKSCQNDSSQTPFFHEIIYPVSLETMKWPLPEEGCAETSHNRYHETGQQHGITVPFIPNKPLATSFARDRVSQHCGIFFARTSSHFLLLFCEKETTKQGKSAERFPCCVRTSHFN